jgi:hypothetical protein
MLAVTQDYIASTDWMIVNNELERLRKEARLVLALDKRSVHLAEYDVVVAIIAGHLQCILKWCLNILAYFTQDLHILKSIYQTYLELYLHSPQKSSWYDS